MDSLFDLLPEELVFELFFLLKDEAVNLGRAISELTLTFNKFIDKVHQGLIQPDLIFDYEIDESILELNLEQSSDKLSMMFSVFIADLFQHRIICKDITGDSPLIILNGSLKYCKEYVAIFKQVLSYCNKHKVYLNVGLYRMRILGLINSLYGLMQNDKNEYIYMELEVSKPKERHAVFFASKNWKEVWSQVSDLARNMLYYKYNYNYIQK